MESMLEFAKGALFPGCFAFLILAWLRTAAVVLWGVMRSAKGDPGVPVDQDNPISDLLGKLFTFKPLSTRGMPYKTVTAVFHACLIIVPILLVDHILLWRGMGLWWPGLPAGLSNALTVICIAAGIILLGSRVACSNIKMETSATDYLMLALTLIIFITGYTASRPLSPLSYNSAMLIHVLCGNALLLVIPFSRLTHWILNIKMRIFLAGLVNSRPKAEVNGAEALQGGEAD